jgi:hypothetical protein
MAAVSNMKGGPVGGSPAPPPPPRRRARAPPPPRGGGGGCLQVPAIGKAAEDTICMIEYYFMLTKRSSL